MENLLSDLEGLKIAMDIERRGFNFYQKAYSKFNDSQAKVLLKTLMEEEQEHLSTFTEYFKQVEARKEAHSAEYLFDAEISKYLTVLVESHVFPAEQDVDQVVNELATLENIIKLALRAEKDSILLYEELAKCSKFEDAKTVFLKLKGEEQRHVTEISQKLKQIINA
jgi:rubrerythrin